MTNTTTKHVRHPAGRADPGHYPGHYYDMGHHHTRACWWQPDEARWVCRSNAVTTATTADPETSAADAEDPLVDVRDMLVVHTAMLREFRLAPTAVMRTQSGDRKQAGTVGAHIRLLCELLHHHHDGEDALLWPKLRARTNADAARVIDEVEAQHTDIDAALRTVGELREVWSDRPDAVNRELLASGLHRLYAVLDRHLDLEERALLPLAASTLTKEEWHALGDAAVASMPKPALVLAFGMFAYEGDEAVLRDMLKTAPPPARLLLPLIAPRVYARRARRVYGTARP